MTTELAKTYDPKSVEKEVYDRWLAAGAFDADPSRPGQAYCIVIPPPNVTAPLHLGHALNNTLQDVLVRLRRMQQYNALWMPGTDHAGIATQTVVEKRILAEEGRRRTDFARDQFVARVQAWKDQYEARIIDQLHAMGCSCDWRRTRFTMDEVCAAAVREAFFRLFADGLIYRGKRLVNWDPATQTVLADDEVEHEEVKGHFWYMRYPLVEPVEMEGMTIAHVTVATTRPETMLGDTAVAMNPADPRAQYLVGKQVRLPIVGRVIPIIADEHVVLADPDSEDEKARFSTGFLKVTPAHDPDDYAIGERHLKEIASALREANASVSSREGDGAERQAVFVNVLAPDGTISDKHGWCDADAPEAQNLIGMDRFEAREAVVEFFRQQGLLEEVRDYTHQVGHSYRSHVPIEPYLSDQWFVAVKKEIADCGLRIADWQREHSDLVEERDSVTYLKGTDVPVNSLAGLALAPLLDGRLKFTPDRYANTYRTWLENLRDWPISRQLWWGHQIPVWSRRVEDVRQGFGKWNEVALKYLDHEDVRTAAYDIESQMPIDGWALRDLLQGKRKAQPCYVFVCLRKDDRQIIEELEGAGLTRDGDVLDTWFSSALWPFSTLGWPDEGRPRGEPAPPNWDEARRFYPGDVLCTAREIITLWVSRMVMMGQYCCGDIPFRDVLIHAMIQDGEGRKMSKSLGNGIDPNDIIDSHGADAMRFTLVSMTTQTQDVRMPVEPMTLPDGRVANTSPKFDIGRNFCNKLWNAARFALMNIAAAPAWEDIRPRQDLTDAWILSRLHTAVRDATAAVESFRFNELADGLYHFMWDDLCDWYLEIAKGRIAAGEQAPKAVLACCLDTFLRLLHPVAPFITEAIWQKLNEVCPVRGPGDEPAEKLLVTARWPMAEAAMIRPADEQRFALLQELIRGARNARTEHGVPPRQALDAAVEADGAAAELIAENLHLLRSQAVLGGVTVSAHLAAPPADAAAVAAGGVKLYVLGVIDRAAERARLGKQADGLRKGIAGAEAKLGNANFVARAPGEVVQRERDRLERLRADLSAVEKALAAL